MSGWGWAAGSILLGAAGQVLMKLGLTLMRTPPPGAVSLVWAAARHPYVLGGVMAYAASLTLWLVALQRLPLTALYPAVSLSYVLVAAAGVLLLGEPLSGARGAGILVILVGVWLVTHH